METNLNKDINTINDGEEKGFLHGGWVYFIFLFFLVGLLALLSFVAKFFM